MSSEQHIGIEDARKRLGDLVTDAQYGNPTVITKNGKPVAALVSLADLGEAVRRTGDAFRRTGTAARQASDSLARIAELGPEGPARKLKYRRTAYPAGIVQIAGFWDAWREQIPALPDHPADLNDETLATIAHSPISYERDGVMLEATLSNLEIRTGSKGPVGLGTLVEKDTIPTRRGECAVCGRYRHDLIEREDASGLTGWVCEKHDDMDIVFA